MEKPTVNFKLIVSPFKFTMIFFLLLPAGLLFAQNKQDTLAVKSDSVLPRHSFVGDWNFRPGDAVKISVVPDTGFPNGIYPVDGQGYVDLPMIGPLRVTRMSKEDFEKKVGDSYANLLRFSSIQVRRLISIGFQGGFEHPGTYWFSPGATLWYAISTTGGPVREDGYKRIKWERSGTTINSNMAEIVMSQEPLAEIGLQSGDIIRTIIRPKRTGWDVFKQDVLPLVSLGLSTAVSSLTVYELYKRR